MSLTEIPNQRTASLDFLSGGGEMGERIRNFEWSKTSIGEPENWEQGLKTCIRIILTSPQPMFIWWGRDLVNIYNDAYKFVLGKKHPQALGERGSEVWKEIWDEIGLRADIVFNNNEGTYDDALLLIMNRLGYDEETYFKFSYNPIPGDKVGTAGLFCACTEETSRIINERSLNTLQGLDLLAHERTELGIYRKAAEVLSENNKDFPFAIIYQVDDIEKIASPVSFAGIASDQTIFPSIIDLTKPVEGTYNFCRAYQTREIVITENKGRRKDFPHGAWEKEATHFVHIPIFTAGNEYPIAILSAGLNPYRKFDEAYNQFVQLIADKIALEIGKIKSYEQERKKAADLAELDKAKTVFFSNISHEFRTPLTLMLGSLEEGLSDVNTIPRNIERMTVTHRNAMRLLKLVNTLLDFSRIESGRQKATYSLTDIALLTKNLASNFRSVIEKAGLKFIVKADAVIQPVYIDKQMWEKIVFNLLSNAFKYTLEGNVTLRLFTENKNVILEVEDTGAGIPEKELPKMFERFHRVDNIIGRTYEGTGIGLSLTKELVSLHGGTISVKSKEGKGSTFIVSIPFGKDHLPVEQTTDIDSCWEDLISDAYLEEAASLLDDNRSSVGQNANKNLPTVLVVDDNPDMRRHIESLLQRNYRVITAVNGMDALHKVRSENPVIVISDIMMPIMNGIQLLKEIKGSKDHQNTPVILLTARAGEESKIEGFQTGADDYLIKPFSAKELLARIDGQLKITKKRHAAERQLHSLFEQAPSAIVIFKGPDAIFELANRRALEIMGKTKEGVIGHKLEDALPELKGQGYIEKIKQVYRSGEKYIAEDAPVTFLSNGIEVNTFVKYVFQPLKNEDGDTVGVMVVGDDVAEQVLSRRKIEESENRFKNVLLQSPSIFCILEGPDMLIRFANKPLLESWGKSWDIVGRTLLEVLPELKDQQFPKLLEQVYKTGKHHFGKEEKATILKNGKLAEVYYNYVYQPIFESDGRVSGITVMASDVTDQVLARKRIEASERELESLANAMPQLVWIAEPNGEVVFYNDRINEFSGVEKLADGSWSWEGLLHEDDLNCTVQEWNKALKEKLVYEIEHRIMMKDGSYRWYLSRAFPIKDADGKVVKWYGTATDIHLIKSSEEQLRKSELTLRQTKEQLELSISAGKIGIWHWDVKKNEMTWSREQLEIFGVNREDFKGGAEDFFKYIVEEDKERIKAVSKLEFQRADNQYEFRIWRKDGEIRWIQSRSKTYMDEQGDPQYITGVNIDITEQVIARKKIEESEKEIQQLFMQAPVSIILFEGENLVARVANDTALKTLGKNRDEVINKSIFEFFPDLPERTKLYRDVIRTGIPYEGKEIEIKLNRNGQSLLCYFDMNYTPWYDTSGKIKGIMTVGVEVTEQVLSRRKIEESEGRFRTMANEAPLFVWETDENLQTTYLNQTGIDYFNLKESTNIAELSWKKYIHPDDINGVLKTMRESASIGESYTLEMRLRNGATGQYRWFLDKGSPRYANKKFIGFLGTSLDIHDRKEVEKELETKVKERTRELDQQNMLLQKQNDLVRKIFDASVDAIGVYDTGMKVITLNQSALSIFGMKADEVIGRNLLAILPQLEGTKGHKDLSRAINGETIHNKIYYSEISDRYYENFLLPLKDENDNVYAVLVMAHDNTDLIASAEKLKEAQQIAQIGHWDWDVHMGQLTWSDNMYNIYGLDRKEEISYEKFSSLVHPADRTNMEANIEFALQSQKFTDFFHRIITPTGEEKIMHVRGEVVIDKKGKIIRMVGTGQDVTKQKMIEQQLIATSKKIEERNQFIEQIINSSLDLITVIDKDMRIITLNKKAQLIYKEYYKEDITGKKLMDINPPVKGTESYHDVRQAFAGKVIIRDKVKSTISDRYYEHNYVPLTDAIGEVYAVMVISHDITESMRQMDELRKLYESDEQKNNFIAMASHELKTPITSIKGYVQLLLNALEKEKETQKSLPPLLVRSSLMSVDKQIKRLTRLISELLDISKIETGTLELKKEKFSLNELAIETVEDILYTNTKHSINLYHDFHGNIYGDKDRIGQVMINFLTNAVKYSPDSDKIDVTIHKISNREIGFSVKDYGIGIDKEEQKRIFERFYRAKGKAEQTYPGFGIGLFIANEFIQKHGGQVWVESEKGKGSVFTFTLPTLSA